MKSSVWWWSAAVAVCLWGHSSVLAEKWALSSGNANWVDAASWVEGTVPNAIGASALFELPTGTRNIDLNGAFTVGSVTFDNVGTNNTTQNIRNFNVSGDELAFDAVGAGPATITSSGNSATNSRIQADMWFEDSVNVVVSNTAGNATAGALSLTGNMRGPGGLTKLGDGLLTTGFNVGDSTQVKEYEGPTLLSGGRWRTSLGGTPTKTSSFTINGGQLTFISNNSIYTLGLGPLNLNGAGPTTGPYAAFPGALRQDTNLIATVTNPVVLQSDSLIHVQGSATGSLTLTGGISGPGKLLLGSLPHDANVGQLVITGTGSYLGGTKVQAGTLVAAGSSITAFGGGGVTVDSGHATFTGTSNKILIQAGATNAIDDLATLSLAGGNAAGLADDGFIDLATGINETVGGLVLGGVTQTAPGSYGATGSGATFVFDEYFAGAGLITLAAPAGVAGDYNNNGVVDAADYVLWRDGGPLQNEVDNPGTVDANDYTAWRARFGNTAGSGSGLVAGAAAPEPAALTIIVVGAGLALFAARRR